MKQPSNISPFVSWPAVVIKPGTHRLAVQRSTTKLRDCSEFLVGGVVLFGKSACKKLITPLRSHCKILVPPPRSRCQKWVTPPPGCWKLFRAARVNRAKVAFRAAGELRQRGILRYSVFFVCVKNGYPPPSSQDLYNTVGWQADIWKFCDF